jgi:hypothetical protein
MRDYEECRPYIEHLAAEHRRVHKMLREAHSAIVWSGGPDRDTSSEDLVKKLRHVRQELEHHFAQEEAGGCMDEAVSRCPRLSAEVKRIEAEHPDMLNELDRLIAQALDATASVASRLAIERGFDDLYHQLLAHEAAENAVLREGFGVNFNGDENGQPNLIFDG